MLESGEVAEAGQALISDFGVVKREPLEELERRKLGQTGIGHWTVLQAEDLQIRQLCHIRHPVVGHRRWQLQLAKGLDRSKVSKPLIGQLAHLQMKRLQGRKTDQMGDPGAGKSWRA